MSTILKPTITSAGLQALINADNNGLDAQITAVGLGQAGYTPSNSRTRLSSEVHRIGLHSGKRVASNQLHLNVIDNSSHEFWVREVGFYLQDGTLFAVYSSPDKALAYKATDVDLLLAFDLSIEAASADKINIDVNNDNQLNIMLAPELAKMATAQINSMTRDLKLSLLLIEKNIL